MMTTGSAVPLSICNEITSDERPDRQTDRQKSGLRGSTSDAGSRHAGRLMRYCVVLLACPGVRARPIVECNSNTLSSCAAVDPASCFLGRLDAS